MLSNLSDTAFSFKYNFAFPNPLPLTPISHVDDVDVCFISLTFSILNKLIPSILLTPKLFTERLVFLNPDASSHVKYTFVVLPVLTFELSEVIFQLLC